MQLRHLINLCKHNNLPAQRGVYDHFARMMFLLCRRYMKNDQLAEEAMMNGFFKFFQSLKKFEYLNDAALTGWIKKLMINECLMLLRSRDSLLLLSSDELPEMHEPELAIDDMSADEIFQLIIKLPTGYRTVFNMFVIEGMSHKEIGEALKISEGTSRSQLSKAKQLLQQMIINTNSDYACRQTK